MAATTPEILSADRLSAYLSHIRVPSDYQAQSQTPLSLLFALHHGHVTNIPYENLGLHYTLDPHISTDVNHILAKALSNGRGGYCMEGNVLFNAILRALGFDAYLSGCRIRIRIGNVPSGPWSGWQHVVNVVTLPDGSKWVSDVAFGGDGPVQPMPLVEDIITPNLGTQQIRLAHDVLSGAVTSQKWWIYQYRNQPTDEWNSYYCFTETEFLLADFEVMNYFCSAKPDHFHRVLPVVSKFLTGEDDEENKVVGKIMLAQTAVKRNMGGRTELVVECRTEEERLEALEKYFGMTFTEEERKGIKGRVSEIRQEQRET